MSRDLHGRLAPLVLLTPKLLAPKLLTPNLLTPNLNLNPTSSLGLKVYYTSDYNLNPTSSLGQKVYYTSNIIIINNKYILLINTLPLFITVTCSVL
jgi:hypothetical protein